MDRWDALFAGLAAEGDATSAAEDDAQAEEASRAAVSEVGLLDRLRASAHVEIHIVHVGVVRGHILGVGRDVVEVSAHDGEWAIPLWGIEAVAGLTGETQSASTVGARLGWGSVLRQWSRQRSPVRMVRLYGGPLAGTLDRVGADHVDIALHDPGLPRLDSHVSQVLSVPIDAISALRRR